MLGKAIAIGSIAFTSIMTFNVLSMISSATNEATTQLDDNLKSLSNNDPRVQTAIDTSNTLDDAKGLHDDVKTVQTKPASGLKNMNFVYPFMVLVAGAVLIIKKLS